MPKAAHLLAAIPLLVLHLATWPSAAEETDGVRTGSTVTPAVLESKIAEVEAARDLGEEPKKQLIELYRKALSYLETAGANERAADEFRVANETAEAQVEKRRAQVSRGGLPSPLADLPLSEQTTLDELRRLLARGEADLGAATAREADFKARLAFNENRPPAIQQRLTEATGEREAVLVRYSLPPAEGDNAALIQARQWALETEYHALSTEIKLLDQELLSLPARMKLLEAKRDQEQVSISRFSSRVEALEELLNRRLEQEAEQARFEAQQAQRETAEMDPLLSNLSESNAELSIKINDVTAQLQALDASIDNVLQLIEQIDADYTDSRETLESIEITGELGSVFREQRRALPNLMSVEKGRAERRAQISNSHVQRLRYRAEERRISDLDARVAALEGELQEQPTPRLRGILRNLLQQRQELVADALQVNKLYLAKQRELDAAEDRLLAVAVEYEAFLYETSLWLRSAEPIGIDDLLGLPAELRTMLAGVDLRALAAVVLRQLASSPAFWLAIALAVALRWRRRRMLAQIESIAGQVGKPTKDSIGLTLRTLWLTLLIAAPLPLVMVASGLHLMWLNPGTQLPQDIGDSLLRVALFLYTLLTLAAICLPQGLAAVHFRWSETGIDLLRRNLRWLIWLFPIAALGFHLALDLDPAASGGTPACLFALVLAMAQMWFIFRIFHPRSGVLTRLRDRDSYSLITRSHWLWYPLLLLIPASFGLLGMVGYIHTVVTEGIMFSNTLLLILALVLTNALALRWLLVARRGLAYEAAIERRRAAREAERAEAEATDGRDVELPFQEPEVDLSALSDEARELIRTVVGAVGLIGLYLIWQDALPALRVFDDVVLWHSTNAADTAAQPVPVTLADLGISVVYGIATLVLATRLPALIEIMLLRRFDMTPSGRYTVTALTNYIIIAIGILLILSTLGARWSQLQWLVAALTVGIGFGLQEIVANFVSGLIILFERPIRVGDTITVGDTDGVVTKIRIRATTIRNWDRKELLVPNKEFISGRLLNWSLSDPITRVVIVVGVAYGSDVDRGLAIMKQVADDHEHVVDDPEPFVTFDDFGDNALVFKLRAYVDSVDYRVLTITDLNRRINKEFADAGIVIAFPQRDVHLDTDRPLRVQIENAPQTG